jgi:mannosyltransferase
VTQADRDARQLTVTSHAADWIASVAITRAAPLLLTLIGFALRMYRITEQSIWRDEGISLYLASSSIHTILTDRAATVHPPLYFILLNLWTRLAGNSALAARFFSLSFGVLLIPALFVAASRVFDQTTALVAAMAAAFSPLYVVYSQEARVYVLLPLAYAVLLYKLERLLAQEGNSRRNWLELAVVEVLCLYLHYFSAFVIASINLVLIVEWAKHRTVSVRQWILSQAGAAMAFVPWLGFVLEQYRRQGAPLDYFEDPLQQRGIDEMLSLVWHFLNGGKDLRAHSLFAVCSSLLALALVAAVLLSLTVKKRRRQLLVTLFLWAAPLSMALTVWWLRPMVHPRYVLMLSVPLLMLMGRAIVAAAKSGLPGKLAAWPGNRLL